MHDNPNCNISSFSNLSCVDSTPRMSTPRPGLLHLVWSLLLRRPLVVGRPFLQPKLAGILLPCAPPSRNSCIPSPCACKHSWGDSRGHSICKVIVFGWSVGCPSHPPSPPCLSLCPCLCPFPFGTLPKHPFHPPPFSKCWVVCWRVKRSFSKRHHVFECLET